MPRMVSMSHSSRQILLMSRISVRSRLANLTSLVVTLRHMICFPKVVPWMDSLNAVYRRNRTPWSSWNGSIKTEAGHGSQEGSVVNSEIIHTIIPMMALSIIPAMSLLNQWSCSWRSVPIFSKAVDVKLSPFERFLLFD